MIKGLEFSDHEHTVNFGQKVLCGRYVMPCGCAIKHQALVSRPEIPGHASTEDKLAYWFANAIPWHDCKLVSDETPSGLMPIDQRKDASGKRVSGPYAYLLTEAAQTA